MAVAASHLAILPIGLPTGDRMFGEHWVPFPDERYKTIAVEWRKSRNQERATPDQQRLLRQEETTTELLDVVTGSEALRGRT